MRSVFSPAIRISLAYGLFASLWILFSDGILALLLDDAASVARYQLFKGLWFILATAVLLQFLLSRVFARLDRVHKQELESAQLLDHYLSVSPAICFTLEIHNGEPRSLWISQSILPMLGYSIEEALAPGWWQQHIHRDDREAALAGYDKLVADKSELDQQYRFYRKDGRLVWIRDQLRYVSRGDINSDVIVGAWTDITELRHSQQDMVAASERRHVLFEEARDGICVLDSNFAVIEANHSFARMTGRDNRELLLGLHPWDWDQNYPTEEAFKGVFATIPGGSTSLETVFLRPDGSVIDVEISINPVGVGGNQLMFTLCRDISERLRAEAELEDYSRELSALFNISTSLRMASDAVSLFSSGLAEVKKALNADTCVIAVLSDDRQQYLVEQASGAWQELIGKSFNITDSSAAMTVAHSAVYVTEDSASEAYDPQLQLGVGVAVFAPLNWGAENEGVLAVGRMAANEPLPFNDNEVRLLASIGEMMGVALHRIHLTADLRRRLDNIQALRNIDVAIAGSLDLRTVLNVALNETIAQLDVDAAAILSFDVHTRRLEYTDGKGFYTTAIESSSVPLGESPAGRAALEQEIVFLPDPNCQDKLLRKEMLADEKFVDYAVVPLVAKGRTLGVLELFNRSPRKRNHEWHAMFEALGGQIAIAMDSAMLFRDLGRKHQELMQAYDATLEGWGWARALALKEEETEEHSKRVVTMTVAIARTMGVSDEELVHVRRGALLHDIGKIGIPDAILLKPGKLTEEEWEIMRRHTTYAYDMLAPIAYLRQALDIPYCHHERWDGSGYPRGLKGQQIPLAARIFSAVDVYDALISVRPYKTAWSHGDALQYLHEQKGKHFDPAVVDALTDWFSQH